MSGKVSMDALKAALGQQSTSPPSGGGGGGGATFFAGLFLACLLRASLGALVWIFFSSLARSQGWKALLSPGGSFFLLLGVWALADAKLFWLRPWILPLAVGLQGQQFVQGALDFLHKWAR